MVSFTSYLPVKFVYCLINKLISFYLVGYLVFVGDFIRYLEVCKVGKQLVNYRDSKLANVVDY